jgi:2'-5' RNA ligase
VRLFFALPIPQPVVDRIVEFQNELRATADGAPLRWTEPGKLHVTALFLGEVEPSHIPNLVLQTREHLARVEPLQIETGRLAFFPNLRRPNTFVLMLDGGPRSKDLHSRLRGAVQPFAKLEDRELKLHLTLARSRASLAAETASSLVQALVPQLVWKANEVALVASELRRTGSMYTVLEGFPLGGQE